MKKIAVLILTAVFILGTVAAGKSFAGSTVGFIDVQRVFNEYKETKKAKDLIQKEEEKYRKELENKQKEIDTAKKNKNLKETEINELIRKKEAELEPMAERLKQLNQEMIAKIQKDIISATQEVSKKVGIDLVLDKQVIIIGGLDLTEKVIYQLNAKTK